LIHGVGQALERYVFKIDPDKKRHIFMKALLVFVTFHFVCLTWIFFRAQTLDIAIEYILAFANTSVPVTILTPFVIALVAIGLGSQYIPLSFRQWVRQSFSRIPIPLKALALGCSIIVIGAMASEGVAPFIYFQF
jgi:alginate O-acetyltransferase complex protein AlgI